MITSNIGGCTFKISKMMSSLKKIWFIIDSFLFFFLIKEGIIALCKFKRYRKKKKVTEERVLVEDGGIIQSYLHEQFLEVPQLL